jgi:isoleucyl-tRNA synthetase
MADWTDYIKKETLSRELVKGVPEIPEITAESFKLEGHDVKLGVKRV